MDCRICGKELKREKEIAGGVHSICLARETKKDKPKGKPSGNEFSGKMATIIIPTTDEQDPNYVFVAVQGRTFQIMRDAEVEVPVEIVEALNNAVETQFISKKIKNANGEYVPYLEPRNVKRFPLQVIKT